MTALYTALISGAAGLLAGVLPSLVVSRRRRLLKVLSDEADVFAKLKEDDGTKRHLQAAMQMTAFEYELLVVHTPWQKAVGRIQRFGPWALILIVYAFMTRYFRDRVSNGNEAYERGLKIAGDVMFVSGMTIVIVLMVMYFDQRRLRNSQSAQERLYVDRRRRELEQMRDVEDDDRLNER